MKSPYKKFPVLAIILAAVCLSGCASNDFKPSSIYPVLPANSSFERKITTIWGQTEVVMKVGEPTVKP